MLLSEVSEKPKVEYGWVHERFVELVPQSEVRWVICIAGASMLIAFAFYLIGLVRGMGSLESSGAGDLVEFQDLYERGAFSDEEMGKVKERIRSNYDDPDFQSLTADEEKPPQSTTNHPS